MITCNYYAPNNDGPIYSDERNSPPKAGDQIEVGQTTFRVTGVLPKEHACSVFVTSKPPKS